MNAADHEKMLKHNLRYAARITAVNQKATELRAEIENLLKEFPLENGAEYVIDGDETLEIMPVE